MLPPLTSQYPQWSRGGKLGISVYPRPLSSENENGLPFQKNSLTEKVRIVASTKSVKCVDPYMIWDCHYSSYIHAFRTLVKVCDVRTM
jgi:hypothetical protein